MMSDYDFDEQKSGSSCVFFWIFAITALFMFLGTNPLWGSEDRWAEITREMMATGDYLHPAVNWRIYFDKPQLSYWFIVPFAHLFGLDEMIARIPSALAALAGLWGTFCLARQLFDRKIAILSCWLLLSCYGFIFWGRTAAADMANMSACILATAWFYHVEEKPSFWKYLVFYLIAFGGALTKGLPAVAVPIAAAAPYLIREKRWLKHLKISNFLAFFIGLGLYFVPFYIASVVPPAEGLLLPDGPVLSGIELVWRENIVRAFNAFDHIDPVYSYLYHLPRILLPWAPFFVLAAGTAVYQRKQLEKRHQDLLWSILLIFLMFTASSSRRWYYILPITPFCCIFLATELIKEEHDRITRTLLFIFRSAVLFAGAAAFAAPVLIPVYQMMFNSFPPLLISITIPVAGLLILTVFLLDNKSGSWLEHFTGIRHRLASLVIGVAVMMAAIFGAILPGAGVFRTEKPFILGTVPLLSGIPAEDIVFYETDSAAKFQFYSKWHGPTAVIWKQKPSEPSRLVEYLQKKQGRKIAIICYDRKREREPLFRELTAAGICTDGLNPVVREPGRGKNWAVYLLNVPQKKQNEKTAVDIQNKFLKKGDSKK